jgi:hypothetical protein
MVALDRTRVAGARSVKESPRALRAVPGDVSPEALFCPSCGNPTARDALTITGSEDVTCLAARVPVATGIEYTTARWSGDGEIRQTEAERRRLQSRMSEERYGTS